MKKKICVYDDIRGRGEKYAERLRKLGIIKKNFDRVESMTHANFKEEMKELSSRQKQTRLGKKWVDESLELDETSIFIIDFDLLKLSEGKTFLTGEVVAYLARCFSRCGLIIGLNQYGDNTFDLTLRGHPESYCDVNIGSKQLDNLGLWGGETKEFRPWYWPQLPNYLESFEEKVNEVVERLEDPICDVLRIKEIVRVFPRTVSDFLGGDPVKMKFKKFVTKSGNGLRGRDKRPTDEMVGRIAAARLSKWLELLVLPGQDILVDVPHLISRYPSLLEGDHADVNTWNKSARFDTFDSLGLDYEKIEEFRFKEIYWLSRSVWFWRKLSDCQKIKEVREPWEREVTKYVFCEDSSSFHTRENCKDFAAELDSPYIRRFVRYFEDVDYRPKMRLLEY